MNVIFLFLFVILLLRHLAIKKQIRSLCHQMKNISDKISEKMFHLSLIDRDLEVLATRLNEFYTSQRNIAGQALHHEEHLKDSIANISHDLRTPLTVITGHLQLLEKSSLSDEQMRRVETGLKKAYRMKELIGAFYDLSVLDTAQKKPHLEQINFSNMLMDFLAENAPLFERRHIKPNIQLPESSVFILTDRNMSERILQNLLANAIRYSSGEIFIALSKSTGEKMFLQMENTVLNAQSIDANRLFERFYTGDVSRHNESTGLGLAVVQLLTEKLGGSISASLTSEKLSITLCL